MPISIDLLIVRVYDLYTLAIKTETEKKRAGERRAKTDFSKFALNSLLLLFVSHAFF